MSDGSASASAYSTPLNNPSSTVMTRIVTLDYRAASAGQTLTIDYILDTDYAGGNVAIQAAVLK